MMGLKFGKLPARPGSISFKFKDFFNLDALPRPPAVYGHQLGTHWGMLANDQYGDCVWAGAAHEHMMWTRIGVAPDAAFTSPNVLADYSAVTGFNPAKPDSDQGTDMQEAASYRRKVGIIDKDGVRHKIDAYLGINPKNVSRLAIASYLFGAVGVGIQVPDSCEDQFDAGKPWTVVPDSQIVGGHYVPLVGRNRNGHFLVVTWGRLHAVTPDFLKTYADEAVMYLTTEMMNAKGLTMEGFDVASLKASLQKLEG